MPIWQPQEQNMVYGSSALRYPPPMILSPNRQLKLGARALGTTLRRRIEAETREILHSLTMGYRVYSTSRVTRTAHPASDHTPIGRRPPLAACTTVRQTLHLVTLSPSYASVCPCRIGWAVSYGSL
jgi:hypothetical protein